MMIVLENDLRTILFSCSILLPLYAAIAIASVGVIKLTWESIGITDQQGRARQMDPDELLARQLQEMEFSQAASGQQQQQQAQQQSRFLHSFEGAMNHVQEAEDALLQAMALSVMPLEAMQQSAQRTWQLNQDDDSANEGGSQPLGVQDFLMLELLMWFKTSFFTWVDSPKCQSCGGATQAITTVNPSPEELSHAASRTELSQCFQCGRQERFPRYNSVAKLLETRCGRCGEWANTFLTIAKAAGFDARYVWDINDHVWTEYWSDTLNRWVHVDCCEAAHDKPLLYEAGWGKKMSYVVAFSNAGAVDVTKRYTSQWPEVFSRRTTVPEDWLAAQLASMTSALRAGLPAELQAVNQLRDAAELQELRLRQAGKISPTDLQGLTGRTTGSEVWRSQRGETGDNADVPSVATPTPPKATCTPWAALPLTLLASEEQGSQQACFDVFKAAGRLLGGGCRASGENGRAEGARNAFDGSTTTKWLDFGGGGVQGSSWIQYKMEPGLAPHCLVSYGIVSANDSPKRDPRDWILEGLTTNQVDSDHNPAAQPPTSHDGTANSMQQQQQKEWIVLDQQKGVQFTARHQVRTFLIPQDKLQKPCTSWRLRVTSTRDPKTANCIQLAGLQLYAVPVNENTHTALQTLRQARLSDDHQHVVTTLAKQVVAAGVQLQTLSMLARLVGNIHQHPKEDKYKQVRASKIVDLISHSSIMALLLAVGFRPLILPAPAVVPTTNNAGGSAAMLRGAAALPQTAPVTQPLQPDVFMVLQAGDDAIECIKMAASVLC